MSLASIFEVFQLSHGPSLPYTTGALKTGQYFRNVLMGVPYHQDNRILIELLGDFAIYGKDNLSNVAIICGLAGYIAGESRFTLKRFYSRIEKSGGIQLLNRTWPFSVDSDLVFNKSKKELDHPNTIRFHILGSEQKILLQTEYFVSVHGHVTGPGSRDQEAVKMIDQFDQFADIQEVCNKEELNLVDYIISAEEMKHTISPVQIFERLSHTWQIMRSSIQNGLKNEGSLPNHNPRQAKRLHNEFSKRIMNWKTLGQENILASIYALAVAEELIDNQLIITAPLCESAALMPAILYLIQEKYSVQSKEISESLLIGGLVGSLLMKSTTQFYSKPVLDISFTISSAMTAAAGCYLIDPDIKKINQAAAIAINLGGVNQNLNYDNIGEISMRYAGVILTAINLALCDYQQTELPFDQYYRQLSSGK
jgi:L-serine deaminase